MHAYLIHITLTNLVLYEYKTLQELHVKGLNTIAIIYYKNICRQVPINDEFNWLREWNKYICWPPTIFSFDKEILYLL